ncbi:MAG: protein translocase subunit SecF [Clostridiales bacterium]|jgi:preprotein translocase subunit SecF|nr:protein translocase subunit SecF [Clostridiales bacterium]
MALFKKIFNRDFAIVQKAKMFFFVSILIIALGLCVGVIRIFVNGSMFNVGTDFQGGYSMDIQLGDKLDQKGEKYWREEITRVAESTRVLGREELGGIRVSNIKRQGSGDKVGLLVKYSAPSSVNFNEVDTFMEDLNDAIKTEIIAQLANGDPYGLAINPGTQVGATMGSELVNKAIIAVLLALLLMMIYIAIRFDFISGLVTIIGLIHDVAIMMSLMILFNIEINAAFIAALIALIGYSVNNTVIIFDRIRENVRRNRERDGNESGTNIANRSVRESLTRTVNTSLTVFIMLGLLVAIGVPDIRVFLWPLIFGLLAGFYSAMFISPSLWALVVNKHPDFMQRGTLTSNIRKSFASKSAEKKSKKEIKKANKKFKKNEESDFDNHSESDIQNQENIQEDFIEDENVDFEQIQQEDLQDDTETVIISQE